MIEQRVKCSFGEYQVPAVVHAVQGDTARVLVFEPDDYTLTGAETASLFCVRPNGTAYSYAGTVSSTYNTITVDLDDDGGALTQAGVVAAQLVLSISGEEGKSFKLGIIVEEALGGSATADDQTFLTSLQAQLNAALSDYSVNGQAFGDSTVLKSAQFSEAITGEKMLANIKYTNGNFTDGIKFDGKKLDAVSIGGFKKILTSTDNLDLMYTREASGLYYCANGVQNCPANYCMLIMVGTGSDSNSVVVQTVFSASYIYTRTRTGSGSSFSWGAWKRVAISTWE